MTSTQLFAFIIVGIAYLIKTNKLPYILSFINNVYIKIRIWITQLKTSLSQLMEFTKQ